MIREDGTPQPFRDRIHARHAASDTPTPENATVVETIRLANAGPGGSSSYWMEIPAGARVEVVADTTATAVGLERIRLGDDTTALVDARRIRCDNRREAPRDASAVRPSA